MDRNNYEKKCMNENMLNSKIISYVDRFLVPFSFDREKYGQIENQIMNSRYDADSAKLHDLNGKCEWVKRGFWTNYKSGIEKQVEMDLYAFILNLIEDKEGEYAESSIGTSLILRSGNGKIITLAYQQKDSEEKIIFNCSDLGILLFRNGIGFIWYEVKFSKTPSISTYIQFQHDFKELARFNSQMFLIKKGKDIFEPFCIGKWMNSLIGGEKLGINYWATRSMNDMHTGKSSLLPDKSLLFQYVYVENFNREEAFDLAYFIANGYDGKYSIAPIERAQAYEPFGNVSSYISEAGFAYVAVKDMTNEVFFRDQFSFKFNSDYFYIYVLLLYQSFSCLRYSRELTKLPAEMESLEADANSIKLLADLDSQINLFLVKSIYETVSNVHHQNGIYRYGKEALHIEGDIKSLTIGLSALKEMERERLSRIEAEKEKTVLEKEERKERGLNRAVSTFGILAILSIAIDAVNFVDWLEDNPINRWNSGDWFVLALICLFTLFFAGKLIADSFSKRR